MVQKVTLKLIVFGVLSISIANSLLGSEDVTLQSQEGSSYILSQDAAELAGTIKDVIADAGTDDPIELPNIPDKALKSIVHILNVLSQLTEKEREELKTDPILKALQALPEWKKNEDILLGLHFLDIPYFGVSIAGKSGKEFFVSLNAAKRLGSIKKIIEERGIGEPLSLPEIEDDTLKILVTLLNQLEPLLAINEKAQKGNKIYIPRAYQPKVNATVNLLDNSVVGELMRAAIKLDLPFLVNALASVIADRIQSKFDDNWTGIAYIGPKGKKLKVAGLGVKTTRLSSNDIKNKVKDALRDGFGDIPDDKIFYLVKHIFLRKQGIDQEYSIADYIPEKYRGPFLSRDTVQIRKAKLTSLFGIERLGDIKTGGIKYISLSDNCFFRFDLDVQGIKEPFKGFKALEVLDLENNWLFALSPQVFNGLKKTKIYLGGNPISPSDQQKLRIGKDLKKRDITVNLTLVGDALYPQRMILALD